MVALLDVIAWPFYLMGGAVLFIAVGGILAIVSTAVLMIVMWKRHRDEKKRKDKEE